MSQVRVRMYRPGGIGDCFLLSFQKEEGMAHMLIDCGILKGTPGGADSLKKAIQNVVDITGGFLDVLVVTHEHWDHVSGFIQAKDEFTQLKIGEVWLAWTEERGNELADRLRGQRSRAKQAVTEACLKLRGLLGADARASQSLATLEKMSLFYAEQDSASLGLAPDAELPGALAEASGGTPSAMRSTADAMSWARLNAGGRVRYLAPVGSPEPGDELLTISGVDGVRVFVLGPPQNETWIKKDTPSKKTPEVYSLASGNNLGFFAAITPGNEADISRPFDKSFEVDMKHARKEAFFQQGYFAKNEQWRQIELDWLWTAERLALQLDSDTNNTSLALAIELVKDGKVLLFPGDAQVGNWLSWQELEWSVKDAQGELVHVKAEDLLKRTALYKVGHHASHNATLRQKGLELMDRMIALIPVYEQQAHEQGKKGWDMPQRTLLNRLLEKTGGWVFRSDQGAPAGWAAEVAGKYEVTDGWVDVWIRESD